MRTQMLTIAARLDARADAILDNLYREHFAEKKDGPLPTSQMAGALRIFAEEIRETLGAVSYREWDEIGDMFTLKDFESSVAAGAFIDSDGEGYYAKEHPGKTNDTMLVSDRIASPRRIRGGDVNRDFTHVAWYNK